MSCTPGLWTTPAVGAEGITETQENGTESPSDRFSGQSDRLQCTAVSAVYGGGHDLTSHRRAWLPGDS